MPPSDSPLTLREMSSSPDSSDSPTPAPANPEPIYPQIRGLDPRAFPYLRARLGYAACREVGRGRYGTVVNAYKVTSVGLVQPPQEFAIKVIVPDEIRLRAERDEQEPREIAYSIYINHPNCVRVWDIVQMYGVYMLIMDFCSNNNLAHYMRQNQSPMDARLIGTWAREVGSGLHYLHSEMELAHRDLKLDNILLDANHHAKIGDYGMIKWETRTSRPMVHTRCGSLAYLPPELYNQNDFCVYDPFKVDIWCFGVVIYLMCTRSFPFGVQGRQMTISDQSSIHKMIVRNIPDRIHKARTTLGHALQIVAAERYPIEQLLELPLCNSAPQ